MGYSIITTKYTAEPIILNINTKISGYLNKVVDKSNGKISTELDFSHFDRVNIYLVRQVLNKQKHLWVKPCDDNIVKFYQSVIFAVAVDFFEKNYCEKEEVPHKIGDTPVVEMMKQCVMTLTFDNGKEFSWNSGACQTTRAWNMLR